jgi:Type II secretion system (T2SS), protein M subtype b
MSFEIDFTPLQKRILAVALAVIPVCVLIAVLFGAIVDWTEHHERMAVLAHERATYQQLIADLPRRTEEIAQIKASGVQQDIFPTSQVSGIAGRIESDMAQIVKSNGGTLTVAAAQIASNSDSPVVGISEHITFTSDIAGLVRILHQIAAKKPALFVERLTIDDPGQGEPAAGPHRLNVDLVVAGYMGAARLLPLALRPVASWR